MVTNLQLSDSSEARQGAAVYFGSTSCAFTVIAATLLFISSFKEKLPTENLTKSNADVPFQSNSDNNAEESQDFDEFMKIQEDESEEWGFNPKANDMPKEVKFRLLQNIPAKYIAESETGENASQSSNKGNYEMQSVEGAKADKVQIAAEDRKAEMPRFNSDEFLVEESVSQSKLESSGKRVVFLLPTPDESDEDCVAQRESSNRDDPTNLGPRTQTLTSDSADLPPCVNAATTENCQNSEAGSNESEPETTIAANADQRQAYGLQEKQRHLDNDGTNVDFVEYSVVVGESAEANNEPASASRRHNANATTVSHEHNDDTEKAS